MIHRALCLATLCLLIPIGLAAAADRPLPTVGDVDLTRYAGRWYEIAKFPNRFQRHCVGDVTATYALRPDGRVQVVNACRRADGTLDRAEGVARRVAGQPASVLEVRFAPAFLSFLPFVWGDYRIVDLTDEYSAVLIGSSNRDYLWILSRQPTLDADTLARLTAKATSVGFDVSKLVMTPQGAHTR